MYPGDTSAGGTRINKWGVLNYNLRTHSVEEKSASNVKTFSIIGPDQNGKYIMSIIIKSTIKYHVVMGAGVFV